MNTREAEPAPEELNGAPAERIRVQQAVVVGIGAYGKGFNNLPNAPNDAQSMADLLKKEYDFQLIPQGTPVINADASQAAIHGAVETSLAEAGESTRWLFYFAGHGLLAGNTGCLLPADAVAGQPDSYLEVPWLLRRCLDSACAEILIILDACFAGQALLRPSDLSDLAPPGESGKRVRQVITSGNPDQPVLDGGGGEHSLFTQALLEALQGWAGIHRADGSLPFTALFTFLKEEVPVRQALMRLNRTIQQPVGGYFSGNRTQRDFVFKPVTPRLNPQIVWGANSEQPAQRVQSLAGLIDESRRYPQRRPLCVQLSVNHLDPSREPDASVRAQAAQTLGRLADPQGMQPLIAALGDQSPVADAAAQALGKLGDKRAAAPLLAKLSDAPDSLYLSLFGALGDLDDLDSLAHAFAGSIRTQKLVPFLGPDLPQALTGLPDRLALAHALAEREGLPHTDSLTATVERIFRQSASLAPVTTFLGSMLDEGKPPGAIYATLARWEVRGWISAAYDRRLEKSLDAYSITTGESSQYLPPDRPWVVRLLGDLPANHGLVLLESEYASLRKDESDRQKLVAFLSKALEGRVVLLLGFDPHNPDFALLVRQILIPRLERINIRPFLLSPQAGPDYHWASQPVRYIRDEPEHFIEKINGFL
ncbi:MAG: caspase family protein [Omnitrophica WOR_2 bacterium]